MKYLILMALAMNLVACAKPDGGDPRIRFGKECAVDNPAFKRMVFFGESQTEGDQSEVDGCRFSYAYVLSEALGRNIVNKAVGGSMLLEGSWKGQSQKYQIEHTPLQSDDVVFWMTGYNDAGRHGIEPVYLANYKAELAVKIAQIASQVTTLYIATPHKMYTYAEYQAAHDLYRSEIMTLVTGLAIPNVVLIDTDSIFSPAKSDFFTWDISHLTPRAQLDFAGALLQAGVL